MEGPSGPSLHSVLVGDRRRLSEGNHFMNKKTPNNLSFKCRFITLLFLSATLLTSINTVSAATTVTNNFSVSANSSDGNSNNSASVTTVINGEVVEDWSVSNSEPISYSSTITGTTSTNTLVVDTHRREQEQENLKVLIAKLQALIALYVSLLHK